MTSANNQKPVAVSSINLSVSTPQSCIYPITPPPPAEINAATTTQRPVDRSRINVGVAQCNGGCDVARIKPCYRYQWYTDGSIVPLFFDNKPLPRCKIDRASIPYQSSLPSLGIRPTKLHFLIVRLSKLGPELRNQDGFSR